MIAVALVMLAAFLPLAQQTTVPDDLLIVVASSPRPAREDGTDAEAVEVRASGAVRFSAKQTEAGILAAVDAALPPEAIAAIWAEVERQRFFELDDVYIDSDIAGGDLATLDITANGVTHAVMTINIGVDAFDAIVEAINAQLPAEREVIYNALHVEGYRRVPR